MNTLARLIASSSVLLLAACGGAQYGGEVAGPPPVDGGTGGTPVGNCDDLFTQRVQPRLEFCRNCHVPGGVADVEGGKGFMLSTVSAEDAIKLRAAWEVLGRNENGPSRILRMAAGTDTTKHSGGMPWPVGSPAYQDVAALLLGYVDPAACVVGGAPVVELDLLGSKRARHLWDSFCEGQDDEALLPPDPRTLVQKRGDDLPNAGRAVYFNALWEDCHVALPEAEKQARTCGEFRARRDRGRHFIMEEMHTGSVDVATFRDTWKKWGLATRPDNFDELYTLRYGLNPAPFDNPYPLEGELPNDPGVNGGSGKLPLGLRQTKDANGKWTGKIATGACYSCHGGTMGEDDEGLIRPENLGLGNANYDVIMVGQDGSPFRQLPFGEALPSASVEAMFNIGIKQRGQNNAVGAFELLVTLLDWDSLGFAPNPTKSAAASPTGAADQAHPIAHTQDTPAWWNMGSRPRKFFDAGVSNDSTRIIMAAGPGEVGNLFTFDGKPYRARIEQYDQDLEAFFLSLKSPPYPGPIDEALARQGAILFHSKPLWDIPANADQPRPAGGNGSCASCHGAYSPRYVHDPAYLEDPVLEGVAAHIATLDVINTDRKRSDMLTPTLRTLWDTTYWGYNEGAEGYVAPEDKDPFTEAADDMSPLRTPGSCGWEKGVIGYQAPPLYGTWATAPYFHNGSVPTIEAVLDSSKRHPLWRRQLRTVGSVTGFDQSLERAYDFDALGWKHEALACQDIPGTEQMNCSPTGDDGKSAAQIASDVLAALGWPGIVTFNDPEAGAIDKRLVYDTRIVGNANTGHEFTDALTEQERRAIIEYLKTL
jgi:endo-cleaving rubber dioxygenase